MDPRTTKHGILEKRSRKGAWHRRHFALLASEAILQYTKVAGVGCTADASKHISLGAGKLRFTTGSHVELKEQSYHRSNSKGSPKGRRRSSVDRDRKRRKETGQLVASTLERPSSFKLSGKKVLISLSGVVRSGGKSESDLHITSVLLRAETSQQASAWVRACQQCMQQCEIEDREHARSLLQTIDDSSRYKKTTINQAGGDGMNRTNSGSSPSSIGRNSKRSSTSSSNQTGEANHEAAPEMAPYKPGDPVVWGGRLSENPAKPVLPLVMSTVERRAVEALARKYSDRSAFTDYYRYGHPPDELTLLRFVRARKGDVDKALKMLVQERQVVHCA